MEGNSVPWKTDQCLLLFVYPEMAGVRGMSRGMAELGASVLRLWERDGWWMLVGTSGSWEVKTRISGKGTAGVTGPWRRDEGPGQGRTHAHTGMNWFFIIGRSCPLDLDSGQTVPARSGRR
jgi:hypothetical protein